MNAGSLNDKRHWKHFFFLSFSFSDTHFFYSIKSTNKRREKNETRRHKMKKLKMDKISSCDERIDEEEKKVLNLWCLWLYYCPLGHWYTKNDYKLCRMRKREYKIIAVMTTIVWRSKRSKLNAKIELAGTSFFFILVIAFALFFIFVVTNCFGVFHCFSGNAYATNVQKRRSKSSNWSKRNFEYELYHVIFVNFSIFLSIFVVFVFDFAKFHIL